MMMCAGNATELADLRAWLVDHPLDADPSIRKLAADWLAMIEERTPAGQYPRFAAVPHGIREVINDVIDDWIEVLSAQPEEQTFHTYVRPLEPALGASK